MCGIAGFVNFKTDYLKRPEEIGKLRRMNQIQKHRGPDSEGIYVARHCGMSHVRLEIIDLVTGNQPMLLKKKKGSDRNYLYEEMTKREIAIVYNGEIYNMNELRKDLSNKGAFFETKSDTEVVLQGYAFEGTAFFEKLNGIYAFAIWDALKERMVLVRDPFGVKPLFYTQEKDTFLFASECKSILAVCEHRPVISREGLCEVLGLGPAKTYGAGIFQGMMEVCPGHVITVTNNQIYDETFFQLEAVTHKEDFEETLHHVKDLVTDAVKMQMLSDVPICTFLSGGLDSSLVTSIISGEIKKKGGKLTTYSFDFVDNDVHFKKNAFQPSMDSEYVDHMTKYLECDHKKLFCDAARLFDYLEESIDARDYPCMADVDSSLLYFCKEVAKEHKVALTGECADEIFGGYPWFYKEEYMNQDFFPWNTDWGIRTMLLKDELYQKLPLWEYAYEAYKKTVKEAPILDGESKVEQRRRQIQYLNIRWFMQTLLDRMDRSSMYWGLEARVPFADKRIVQYLYNVPWEMKAHNGIVKGLLREAAKEYLPKEVYERRKSPYPKTYDPKYEKLVKARIIELMKDQKNPLNEILDYQKVKAFCESKSDYGRPFYGQLMAGPQLLGYFIQLEYWIRKFDLEIRGI